MGLSPDQLIAATGDGKGNTVEYITFGLQFECQVALVDDIKAAADKAGVKLNIIDGKGDPNLQVTQVLDAVTKQPDAILINPVNSTLLVAGVKRANKANISRLHHGECAAEGKYSATLISTTWLAVPWGQDV
ncbi:substrate-binding domain-containing protein [Rhizobium grahamii]|uniref:Ribose abc transporter ribose-binding protein n=1 Tax=Rhizobium grahamii CCGE 502 TaxID=990285 RepID=S3HEQ0_9HYPH|nr:substrate-binding domain-containing protein [Rhizobium grahamii]EPE96565.1 ribose abc transporter ribose-binding protein [Rhizobium grahamii CCGE 502]